MNGTIEKRAYKNMMVENLPENEDVQVKSSPYSMAAIGSGILLCVGIVIYAILTH